ALELPGARTRPTAQGYRGQRVTLRVGAEVTEGLRALGRAQGATLFMVLTAGFSALLSRYTGERDVVVGTDVANRTRGETEPLIGFFVNQLVLRTDLAGDPAFKELVGRVREVCLGAYAHQDLPFERVVEELAPERTLSHTPLFQVKLLLQNAPAEALQVTGLSIEGLKVERETAEFDLTVSIGEAPDGLYTTFEYNADLFEAGTVERLGEHYRELLAGAAADPSLPLSRLPLLTDAERRRLLVEHNETARPYRRANVHELFGEHARQTPDADAVVCGGERLSYRELDERSNRLARYLRSLGVGPETLVGICLERSAESVTAVLGVLKAGAAYLPLDPDYPAQRLGWMLGDSGAGLVLTRGEAGARLPAHWGLVINLDEADEQIRAQDAGSLEEVAAAGNLAYVIYTSGSTGKPKGVMVEHGGLTNLASAQRYFLGLGPGARMLQFASLSFDAAAFELFTALCSGACSCVATSGERAGEALAAMLRRCGVTHATLPPAVLAQLDPEEAPELATVISVGEALPAWVAARWAGEGRRLLNGYGPTEATVGATVGECLASRRVGIGRPLPNVRAYVLDESLNPTPVGVAGELHVGGKGIARGYLNRPALTAERFVPDPFSGEPGSRLYRTGDVCRWNEGGELEYVGRADEQVKVRGFRVEPGEIEAALCLHPNLQAALVLPRQDDAEQTSLVAYCVARQGQAGEGAAGGALVRELRSHLAERLPPYMVPSAFVMLDQLPLTPNGKVDRAALPEPERVSETAELAPPRTPVEEILSGIWKDVLRVESVSIHDNFFELGGHSLLATQLVSRVRELFRVEVALRLLFEQPTVAGFAEKIEALLRAADADAPLPPIEPVPRDRPLPLSFAQQRLWFIDQLEGGSAFYNVPAALRLRGDLNVEALERALSEIMRRHEVLRTYFEVTESQTVQVIAEGADVRLPVTDLSRLDEASREAEAARLFKAEAEQPFDLTRGPLLRASLLRLGVDEHALLLTMHHIASDAWSLGVLVREAAALYEAFAAGSPSPLAELPVQYADYAAWQRRYLAGERLE
ncbi:MAG TPA: amino acid adenylation domain-containing protein, partial [Pyrinomonadaceae bacterium]|nr:amino acid adenylation domain-containing protein [Pyrinomonadaceae bacterium]